MRRTVLTACLLLVAATSRSAEPPSPIERYRKLEFPPNDENFDKGWKDRVAADYDVINSADLTSLRADLPPFYGPGAVRVGSTVTDGSSGRRSAAASARGTIAPYSAGVRYPSEL